MENIQEYINEQVAEGTIPEEEILVNGTSLKRSKPVENMLATLKRQTKTRKVRVLAFEEWSDGVWVKHITDFNHTEGKRQYTPRERYSRPESVVEITEL